MAKRTINAKESLADIKAGLDSAALMDKYQLTEKGLQNLSTKLAGAAVSKNLELEERQTSSRQKAGDPVNRKEYLDPMEAFSTVV